jgi:hypothetical protein
LDSGGAGWICLWKLDDLLGCIDLIAPEPAHVYECKRLTAQLASVQQHSCADVNSMALSADVLIVNLIILLAINSFIRVPIFMLAVVIACCIPSIHRRGSRRPVPLVRDIYKSWNRL